MPTVADLSQYRKKVSKISSHSLGRKSLWEKWNQGAYSDSRSTLDHIFTRSQGEAEWKPHTDLPYFQDSTSLKERESGMWAVLQSGDDMAGEKSGLKELMQTHRSMSLLVYPLTCTTAPATPILIPPTRACPGRTHLIQSEWLTFLNN